VDVECGYTRAGCANHNKSPKIRARCGTSSSDDPFRVLPILQNRCAAIDGLYIEEVHSGRWSPRRSARSGSPMGNKVRTTDVDQHHVAEQLDDPWKRLNS
jgi:hypothetical protein